MTYSFLVGSAIFVISFLVGRRVMRSGLGALSEKNRKELLATVNVGDLPFGFSYAVIFVVVLAIFDMFPTIPIGIKFASAMAFFIFIMGVAYNSLVKIRALAPPNRLFNSVLFGFFSIVCGYVAFVFLIRDSLGVRIWY